MEKENLKKKHSRLTYKRWGDDEVKMLLKYLQEHQEIEKPTAQIYYRKLIDAIGIDASWDLLRWKVKNLKKSYIRAQTWKQSPAAALLENDEGISSVQVKLRRMCRFYDELHNIYKLKSSEFRYETYDIDMGLGSTPVAESSLNEKIEFCGFEVSNDCSSTPAIQYTGPEAAAMVEGLKVENDSNDAQTFSSAPLPSTYPSSSSSPKESQKKNSMQECSAKLKRAAPENSLDQLFAMQSERNEFLILKIDFEREKFKKKFDLKERRFEEKIKERRAKLELKKLEMEKEERLRILELEKQERIERLEIEMRYK